MRAVEIIAAKITAEGFNISEELLRKKALERVAAGKDYLFVYGSVVFTVAKDPMRPMVHLYSVGAGTGLLSATAKFMQKVWKRTGHTFLLAPILEPRVQMLASRMGWRPERQLATGHILYRIERN